MNSPLPVPIAITKEVRGWNLPERRDDRNTLNLLRLALAVLPQFAHRSTCTCWQLACSPACANPVGDRVESAGERAGNKFSLFWG